VPRAIDLLRSAFEAFTARDVERFLELVDPEVELSAPTGSMARGGQPYRGHVGIRTYFSDVADLWQELRVIPQRYAEREDTAVAIGRVYGRDATGTVIDSPAGWLLVLREGRILSFRVYASREPALEAAALREDELEQIDWR
jgi:ketosteroid isomerase-like protein